MIRLESCDPAWERHFAEEAATLHGAFGALARRIEHVGSTAVERSYPYFHKPAEWPHTYHIHLCEEGSVLERKHIAFRDRLRASEEVRRQYAALKRELAQTHRGMTHDERLRYADGKTDFVRAVIGADDA